MESTDEQRIQIERPQEVMRAVQFLFAAIMIGLITAILNLAQRISGAPMIFALLIVIGFFGLCYLLIRTISAGRNWARIILLVLVLLNLPFAVLSDIAALRESILLGTLSIIIIILQLIGTYLLFTKNSKLWFRMRK